MSRARVLLVVFALAAVLALVALFDRNAVVSNGHDSAHASDDWARAYEMREKIPEEELAAVDGKVLDSDSRVGIGSATVCLRTARSTSTLLTRTPICAISRQDGTFSLTGVRPGEYALYAIAAHYSPAELAARLSLLPATHQGDIELQMRAGAVKVEGSVQDLLGGAIEGAIVSLASGPHGLGAAVYTDSDGSFALWTAPDRQSIAAAATGYAPTETVVYAPAEEVTILLMPEAVIEGIVLKAGSNEPIPGARVDATLVGGRRVAGSFGRVLSDGRGRFRLSGLHPGEYRIIARLEQLHGRIRSGVRLGLGETRSDVVVYLEEIPVLAARVLVEGPREEPCHAGSVKLSDSAADINWAAHIHGDGQVEIPIPAEGIYDVMVNCLEHVSLPTYPQLRIAAEAPEPQIWYVRRGQIVSGRVLAPDGRPVPRATVMATEVLPNAAGPLRREASTDDEGDFLLAGLSSDGEYHFRVRAAGYTDLDVPVLVRAPASGLVLTLGPGGLLRGKAIVRGGNTLPTFNVLVDGQRRTTTAPNDGSFEIDNVPEGFRTIALAGAGGAPVFNNNGEPAQISIEVSARGINEVEFEVESYEARISGRVVDTEGVPVPLAFVVAQRETSGVQALRALSRPRRILDSVPTDENGVFAIEGLSEEGTYSLRALVDGGGEARATNVETGSDVTLAVEGTGTLQGAVISGAEYAPSYWLSVENVETQTRRVDLYRGGIASFSYDRLPAGSYRVFVRSSHGSVSESAEIVAGKTTNLQLQLEQYGSVRGRLIASYDRAPVAGVAVVAKPTAGGFFTEKQRPDLTNRSKADGSFVVPDVPADRVTIHAVPTEAVQPHAKFGEAHVSAWVEPGAVTDIGDVELPRRRSKDGEEKGDLGFTVARGDHLGDQTKRRIVVQTIRGGGPAAGAGLRIGDTIRTVDGTDVTGNRAYFYSTLVDVRPGAALRFALEREAIVTIVAE